MSLLNVIGDIGSVWNAYDAAERGRADRAYLEAQRAQEQERQKIAAEMDRGKMEEYRRQQALQAQIRQTIASGSMSPDQGAIPGSPALTVSDLDTAPDTVYDPGKPGLPAVKGQMNRGEGFRKAATVAQQAGEWKLADDLDQRAKAYKQEGLAELAQDLMGGADYRQAIRSYNARGDHRIDESTAQFDPNTKRLVYQSPNGPGMFDPKSFLGKNPKLINVPQGTKVIEEGTGRVVADNPKPADNWKEKEDYKQKQARDLAQYKSTLTKTEGTALERNLEALKSRGIAKSDTEAFSLLQESKSKPQGAFVTEETAKLVRDRENFEPDVKDPAKRTKLAAESARAVWAAANPGKPAPAKSPQAQETKTIGGKRYEKVDGQWYEAN